jgi:hypothetical protein
MKAQGLGASEIAKALSAGHRSIGCSKPADLPRSAGRLVSGLSWSTPPLKAIDKGVLVRLAEDWRKLAREAD